MRVLNEPVLRTEIKFVFQRPIGTDDPAFDTKFQEKFLNWLNTIWVRHLLKSDNEFKAAFVHPVLYTDLSAIFDFEGLKRRSYHVTVRGEKRILYLEGFDAKDADNGILYYYEPTKSFLWFVQQHPEVLEYRDFFYWLLEIASVSAIGTETETGTSDVSFNKYTPANFGPTLAKWHLDHLREKANKVAVDWSKLKSGQDWQIVYEHDGYQLLRLLTPKALNFEGQHMDHCIDGQNYKKALFNGKTVFLSVRQASAQATPLASAEGIVLDHNAHLFIIQLKGVSNAPPVEKAQQFFTKAMIAVGEVENYPALGRQPDGSIEFKVGG